MANEQVGNDSYITMTPGSAVAGQLQQILTQRRLEARQNMLDQLASRNIESQISDRDQNTETNKVYRQSLADEHTSREEGRAVQEDTRRAGMLSQDQPLAPEDAAYWKRRNPSMVIPGQAATDPLKDGEYGPERPATPDKFYGLPAQRETNRKAQQQQEAIKALQSPEFAKLDPVQQAYVYEQATLHQPQPGLIKDKADSWGPIFDANGRNTGEYAPGNAHFLPRDPKDPTPPGMTPFKGVGDDGSDVNLGYNPRTNTYEPSKMPSGVRVVDGTKGNAIPKTGYRPPKVSSNTWGLWSQAVDKVLKGRTDLEGDLNTQAARIAQELNISQHAAKAALDTFRDPKNRARSPKFSPADGATSDEAAQSQQLWDLISAGFKQAPQQ